MSVINQMLRDLDKRSASPLEPALGAGTSARAASRSPHAKRHTWRFGGVVGALVAVSIVAGLVWWWSGTPQLPPVSSPVTTLPAEDPVPSASAVPAPWSGLKLATELSELPALSTDTRTTVVKQAPPLAAPAASVSTPAIPVVVSPPVAVAPLLKPDAMPAPAAQLASTPPAPPSAKPAQPVADAAVAAQRQQTAVREVLSQAQSLYTSGSADAAIQLLQDSLAGAERAQPPTIAATQLLLVRELARMELAQGRSAAVLELMTRVEPLLAGQPELWAVRANAAQRLGRHQDAVQFYGVALQSRPAEQRWLLGSAVSLSALGQLVAAAELAERARSVGPVSREVWAYLRQQGVALPEKP
ncbi:MAG: hypothetical protein U5L73_01715 [Rhodoferax sp.]|uniref:hypothetical protein n=1 Tax=Rhodoferax sp. TaxID=50421 RepID=UPI002ACDE8EF|nr:hypothetical protein [Rhodoferax sp.]MDZ7890456.1 hypothetical protein [Rhodoferax sp.]